MFTMATPIELEHGWVKRISDTTIEAELRTALAH